MTTHWSAETMAIARAVRWGHDPSKIAALRRDLALKKIRAQLDADPELAAVLREQESA